jgi:hypothetical protein
MVKTKVHIFSLLRLLLLIIFLPAVFSETVASSAVERSIDNRLIKSAFRVDFSRGSSKLRLPRSALLRLHKDQTFSLSHRNITGTWALKGNPYCLTDRFYDEIVLNGIVPEAAESKVANIGKGEGSEEAVAAAAVPPSLNLRFSARVYGRHTRKDCLSLTRGTVLQDETTAAATGTGAGGVMNEGSSSIRNIWRSFFPLSYTRIISFSGESL